MSDGTDIADNLQQVLGQVEAAARSAGRDPADITLIAVSKTKPASLIADAIGAGQRVFGENRLQELEEKWPDLQARYPQVELHCIGPLQSRKVAPAVALFDVIHTIDREKTARAAAKAMAEQGRRPDCLIQINTGEEPQKAGIAPPDADAFIELCRGELDLPVRGLMCIPPVDEEPSPHFALLKKIADRNQLEWLSMGMSADFEIAIQFGATHVRVGTAIFGARGT
ncbi:MAG: YggS family pyridoxal phosphate-dependent enzyme [Minwuia sp.]|uniref:YggS family pyridoxal phosphate-dependent enzyme n=1 Tax=Minwuia sp. TaxID=2493630 RepID=UPI003A8799E2